MAYLSPFPIDELLFHILVLCDYPQVKVTEGERPVTTGDSARTILSFFIFRLLKQSVVLTRSSQSFPLSEPRNKLS